MGGGGGGGGAPVQNSLSYAATGIFTFTALSKLEYTGFIHYLCTEIFNMQADFK